MTQPELDQYLASVASHLSLPADQARQTVLELRTHLYADFADRLRAGQEKTSAVQQAVAEIGSAVDVAMQLNQEHGTQGAALRTILALELSTLGLALGMAVLVSCSRGEERSAAFPLGLSVIVGAAFLAGYIARRRGWAFGLLPAAVLLLLPTGIAPPANSENPLLTLLGLSAATAIAGGLGSSSAAAGSVHRASAKAVAGYLSAVIVAALISSANRGRMFYDIAAPAALGVLLITFTWVALRTLEDIPHGDMSPGDPDAGGGLA